MSNPRARRSKRLSMRAVELQDNSECGSAYNFLIPKRPSSPALQLLCCMTMEALLLREGKLVETDIVFRNILHSGFTWGGILVWRFGRLFFNAFTSFPPSPAENDGLVRSLGLSA